MFLRSIKTKFIAVISVLILLLFGLTGLMLLKEKSLELSQDVYWNAKSFAELTVDDIVELNEDFLQEDSFFAFNREIKSVFKKNEDIEKIYLVTYSGDVVYDSALEWNRQYSGERRSIEDEGTLERVQARNPSFLLESGRLVYVKQDSDGDEYYVDANENSTEPISEVDRVIDIVYPYDGQYAVVYGVTYDNLQARIDSTRARILTLMVLGMAVAFFLSYLLSSSVVKPVKALEMGALKIATGDFGYKVPVNSNDELGILSKAFNKMGDDLEASTQALVYKERVAKELELASKIQHEILPKQKPTITGFDIGGGLVAADEVGGDCYDFIQADKENLYVYLGDVTGHGVAAGLVASVANALLYSSTSFTDDPKKIVEAANSILVEKTTANMFMTMVLVRLSGENIQYVSAGHNQVLKYNAAEKKVEELETGGMALGMVADIAKTIQVHDIEMKTGDVLVLYSDGIPEAKNEKDEQYGMPRFKRAVSEYCDLVTADGIKNALLADAKEFMGDETQADDMTVVVVKKV